MKKTVIVLAFLCTVTMNTYTQSPHMIVCTLKKYPTLSTSQSENKKSVATSKNQTQGIYGSYFGYLSPSNTAGQITFPRKHNDIAFKLAVTNQIEPIFMVENTINTWRIPENAAYAYYAIERKKDTQTNLYFWDVQKETLPKDRALPLNVITFIAKPEDLYVPTGITITNNNPQLALPPIFVKGSIQTSENALSVIPIRQFFESIDRSSKTEGADVQSKLAHTTS